MAVSLGFSSCCSMFGKFNQTAGYRVDTYQVKTCRYELVTEQVVIKGGSKSCKDGLVVTNTKKVPIYKTVTKKTRIKCDAGPHFFCPQKDCGGMLSDSALSMVTAQNASGSPAIGLVPTMKKLAP